MRPSGTLNSRTKISNLTNITKHLRNDEGKRKLRRMIEMQSTCTGLNSFPVILDSATIKSSNGLRLICQASTLSGSTPDSFRNNLHFTPLNFCIPTSEKNVGYYYVRCTETAQASRFPFHGKSWVFENIRLGCQYWGYHFILEHAYMRDDPFQEHEMLNFVTDVMISSAKNRNFHAKTSSVEMTMTNTIALSTRWFLPYSRGFQTSATNSQACCVTFWHFSSPFAYACSIRTHNAEAKVDLTNLIGIGRR